MIKAYVFQVALLQTAEVVIPTRSDEPPFRGISACGIPVITSNLSSLPEVAGDAAILVDPTDTQAMVEAIIRLRNDFAYRSRLIEKGFARVKHFTWEAVAKQVAAVYEKVINREKGS